MNEKARVVDAAGSRKAAQNAKVLKMPPLSQEQAAMMDGYIKARRREQAAAADAERLKPGVLEIVKERQQVSRSGAIVTLDHAYRWFYTGEVTCLAKQLSDRREKERETGVAKVTASPTVAFEDVRRKDREKREAMEKAS